MTFGHPEAAWALAAAVAVLALRRLFATSRFAAVATGRLLISPEHRASLVRRLPAALVALSLLPLVGALMDPELPHGEERVQSRGLDIAIVLDLSSSMEEVMGGGRDPRLRASRLAVTKRAIAEFITRRSEDRVGLVVFSDNAYVVSPLTTDHAALQRYVAMIDTEILRSEGMTAIGEGLTAANTLLTRQAADDPRRSRVIVMFTDGENNYGRDPFEALDEARAAGHRVHVIGVELEEAVRSAPQVLRLIRTVERRGGRYFTADSAGQLAAASGAIDSLETGVVTTTRIIRHAPAYEPFAAVALAVLCAALLLRGLPFFTDLT